MPALDYEGPTSKRSVFTSRHTHPLLLDLVLIKHMGPEYLSWEPETVWEEIARTFKTSISEVNKSKVQAVRTCHIIDRPYEAWDVFEKVVLSLGGYIPKFDVIQKPTPHLAASAMETMLRIRKHKFSDEVWKYVAAVFLDNGFAYAPGTLEPANRHIRVYVDAPLQERVKDAIRQGIKPQFDGSRNQDVQIAKSRSVLDFAEHSAKQLLKQIAAVLGNA